MLFSPWQDEGAAAKDGANKPESLRAPQSVPPRIAKDSAKFNGGRPARTLLEQRC